MPDKNARWITTYEMSVYPARVRGRPLAPLSLDSLGLLCDAAKLATAINEPIKDEIDSGGRYLFLQDMEISTSSQAAAFVWTLGNQAASAPVFHNIQGNRLRTVDLFPGESVAISAHMVIDFDDPKSTMRYLVGLEDIEGIARVRIEQLLERELRKLITVSADSAGREKEGEPSIRLDSVPGQLMGKSGARPVEIELLKLTPRRSLSAANEAYFAEAKREVVFRANFDSPIEQLLDALPDKVRELRSFYPDHRIRVRWKRPGESRFKVTQIDPVQRAEALLERAITSSTYISDLGFEMPDATASVERRLVKRILEVLRSTAR